MTKRIIIHFLPCIIFVFSCKTKNQEIIHFNKKIIEIKTDVSIYGTVLSHNKIISFSSDGKLLFLNLPTFEKDTSLINQFSTQQFDAFYQIYDSLILVKNNYDYYLNNNFELIPYQRYTQPFYKKDTTIQYDFIFQENKFIDPLFCDSNFIITSFCAGEFGGTLYFFNLKTQQEYYFPATCGNTVNKIDKNYYVTTSLNHMEGFSEVFEISNINNLTKIQFDTLQNWFNFWQSNIWNGNDLKKFDSLINIQRGYSDKILDTVGVSIFTSFTFDNKLFHIYYSSNIKRLKEKTDATTLRIGQIIDKKLIAIDSVEITGMSISQHKNRIYKNWTISSYSRNSNSGFIGIHGNNIYFVQYVKNE